MDANEINFHPPSFTSRMSQDESISWYHGKITRDAAEQILTNGEKHEGQFLVRESISSPGDYVLSLISNGIPVHYQIRRYGEDAFFSIDEGPIIHGLEMLIQYYQEDATDIYIKLGPMCKANPPPPDARRHGRTNLLHRATKEGDYMVVKELLNSGYHSLDAKNQEGQTAVHLASITGHDDIILMLLQAGANANVRDSNGLTPLHYSCELNCPATVRVLLNVADINPQIRASSSGWVPMHDAASRGHIEVLKVLLEFNVPSLPRTNSQETPYDLAIMNKHYDCASLLSNYVSPTPKTTKSEWFHERLNREETSKLFKQEGLQDGLFLVRRSSRKEGIYVLSMVHGNHIFNFEIQQKGRYFFIDDGPYLNSLEHVVEHYSKLADGLPTNLVIPVKPDLTAECITNKVLLNNNSICKKDLTTAESYSAPNLIRKESLMLGITIGEGEFGSVLRGIWLSPKQIEMEVAIKTLRDEQIPSGKEGFIREVDVMVGLDHPCIVQLLGVCLGPPLMMVQELVPMGALLDFLIDFPNHIDDQDLKLWAAQIAWGMMYLENKRFVHRDLATRNILLASKRQAKISDFGLSRALGTGSEYYKATSGGRWPVKWYAPESINFGTFSHASDVWSYGVTLWEMFSFGDQPYGEMNGTQVIQLLEMKERLPQPETCPDKAYNIMMNCWEYEPQKRPTFNQLHHLFSTDPEYASVWDLLVEK